MSRFRSVALATVFVFQLGIASSVTAQVPCPCPVPLTSYQAQVPCTVPSNPQITCTIGVSTNPLLACPNARACCISLGGYTYGRCTLTPDQGGGEAVTTYCTPETLVPKRWVRCYYGSGDVEWVDGVSCDDARNKCSEAGGSYGPVCYLFPIGGGSQVQVGVSKCCEPQRRRGLFRRCR